MDTRSLHHTNLNVSRICLGTMTFGAQCDEAEARRMVDLCLDRGINFIDTANVYNGGAAEAITGRILHGRRSRVVLATKVGLKMGEGADQSGLSRRAILRAVEESLARLRTDYLDIYYLHQPDYTVPLEETLAAIEDLVRAGKVRYAATSNYAAWQVCRIACLAQRTNGSPARIAQPMYNLLARGIEQEFLPMAKELGVSTVVYNPLAGGLLTGKHRNGAPEPGTRFDQSPAYRSRYWHETNLQAVAQLAEAACSEGRSLVSLALNWILHHTPADCVVLGASRLEQLRENLDVLADGGISPQALAACDQVWAELRGRAPQYNR
jgi:aryl-alcohol dehydrogenase-like predicted oxidoreductase